VPFLGNNYLSVISQVLNEEPRALRELRPDLSEEFEAIVLRAMDKERTARYPSANALLADVSALLDDPTRSTERAKITGPRRRSGRSKSPLKIAIWVALVAVVISAVVTTVVMLFGGTEVVKKGRAVVPPPPPPPLPAVVVDGAAPPPDAAPAPTLEVTLETVPPGATIQQDGVDKGPAPITTRLVIDNHFTEFRASAPGYEDWKITINAYVDKTSHYKLVLKKLAKGAAPVTRPGSGATGPPGEPGRKPPNKTGGELHDNPFNDNSIPPPPKP
jgi:hypothetical protein